jgi:tripartite-type tricarboxylate transporter receptor subunit TctC
MKHKKTMSLVIILAMLSIVLLPVARSEATYPEKPIEIVYHAKAGGGGSIFLNALGKAIEQKLGQPFIVKNMPGSAGAAAWTYVARAKADGYTLLGTSSNIITTPIVAKMPINYKDFEPVAMLFIDSMVIFVPENSPYKALKDLINDAKASPGKIKFSAGGAGGLEHVAINELGNAAGVKFPTVPLEGGGDIVVTVMGGHVDAGVEDYAVVAPTAEAGKVRILATFNKMVDRPEIPSIAELGYKDIIVEKMRGVVAPKGTPAEVIDKLIEVLKTSYDDPSFQQYYKASSLTPMFRTKDDFAQAMDMQFEMVSSFYKADK